MSSRKTTRRWRCYFAVGLRLSPSYFRIEAWKMWSFIRWTPGQKSQIRKAYLICTQGLDRTLKAQRLEEARSPYHILKRSLTVWMMSVMSSRPRKVSRGTRYVRDGKSHSTFLTLRTQAPQFERFLNNELQSSAVRPNFKSVQRIFRLPCLFLSERVEEVRAQHLLPVQARGLAGPFCKYGSIAIDQTIAAHEERAII